MRGLHAGPGDSILPLGPRQDWKGEEGEGRSRQPFSLTVQNTQTRSRDAGSSRNGAPRRPPAPRALAQSGAEEGEPGSPRPSQRLAERRTVGSHTPLALLPSLRSSCWPRKSASSWRGGLLTARHRRLLFRSRARGGSRQLQDSVPDQGRAWVHPRPGGDWRQSVSRGCGRVNTRELHRGRRNSLLAAPASSSSSSAGGDGPLPSSPLRPGLSLSSDSGRCVSPASPPPAPPPAVAASPSPGRRRCPRSGPGRFAAALSSLPAPTGAPGAEAAASRERGGSGGLPRGL